VYEKVRFLENSREKKEKLHVAPTLQTSFFPSRKWFRFLVSSNFVCYNRKSTLRLCQTLYYSRVSRMRPIKATSTFVEKHKKIKSRKWVTIFELERQVTTPFFSRKLYWSSALPIYTVHTCSEVYETVQIPRKLYRKNWKVICCTYIPNENIPEQEVSHNLSITNSSKTILPQSAR